MFYISFFLRYAVIHEFAGKCKQHRGNDKPENNYFQGNIAVENDP